MWTWGQTTGGLLDPAHRWIANGYSGIGAGKNNPVMQSVHSMGPIPCGHWTIDPARDDPHLGPCVMRLVPWPDTETFGRSGFYIHGDSHSHPGLASHGCPILGPVTRSMIAGSTDRTLFVVPSL